MAAHNEGRVLRELRALGEEMGFTITGHRSGGRGGHVIVFLATPDGARTLRLVTSTIPLDSGDPRRRRNLESEIRRWLEDRKPTGGA